MYTDHPPVYQVDVTSELLNEYVLLTTEEVEIPRCSMCHRIISPENTAGCCVHCCVPSSCLGGA